MKTIRYFRRAALLLPALAVGLPSQAQETAAPKEDEARTYVSVQAGMNGLSQWNGDVNFGGPVRLRAELELKRGPQAAFALGRQRGKMRYELEARAGRFKVERVKLGAADIAADRSGRYETLMLNLQRSFDLSEKSSLMLGAGIGYGRVRLPDLSAQVACSCMHGVKENGLAYQVQLGLERRMGEADTLFLTAGRLSLQGGSGGYASGVSYERRATSQVMLGWRHVY